MPSVADGGKDPGGNTLLNSGIRAATSLPRIDGTAGARRLRLMISGTIKRTSGGTMARRLNLNTDIRPVSEFRANAAELIEQVKSSRRPLVLTQRGHSAAVVMDVNEYQRLIEEIELLTDVNVATRQIQRGEGVSDRTAKAELRKRFKR
jgi:prevent-host-death family protein